jgi:hypothetical protein
MSLQECNMSLQVSTGILVSPAGDLQNSNISCRKRCGCQKYYISELYDVSLFYYAVYICFVTIDADNQWLLGRGPV